MAENTTQVQRPEFVAQVQKSFGVVEKPLTPWEKIYNQGAIRKAALLFTLAVIWEIYARWLDNPLLFPTFSATLLAFANGFFGGELFGRVVTSLRVLLIGYS